MRPLAAVERFFERVFERPTARIFHARVQPVQIQRRLERAIENERLTSSGKTIAPNRYAVHLNPEDLASFEDLAESLAVELADGCLAYARGRHYSLVDRPRVTLVPDEAVTPGEVRVIARFAAADGRAMHPQPSADERHGRDDAEAEEPDGPFVEAPASPARDATMVFERPLVKAPRARLRLVLPDGAQRVVELDGRPTRIGRGSDNDLVVPDGRVSRHHARIQARSGSLILADEGSTNGTKVNGFPVGEVALGEGDRIELGDSLLIVESAAES